MPSNDSGVGSIKLRNETVFRVLGSLSSEISNVQTHRVKSDKGVEVGGPTVKLQRAPQVYKEVNEIAPCRKIMVQTATEHTGRYCPRCSLGETG